VLSGNPCGLKSLNWMPDKRPSTTTFEGRLRA